ncbi:MAG TPA: hypothetical protein VNO34_06035 [Actinomycetota bacterium]|nr:hypothetical protein [Actinomycetota bacterium]
MRRAAPLLGLLLALLALSPSPARAHGPVGPDLVVVFFLGGVSLEEAMAVPEMEALARLGGVGLMTTRARGPDRSRAALLAALDGVSAPEGEEETLLERVLRGAQVTVCWHRRLEAPGARPCPGGRDLRTFDHVVFFDLRAAMPAGASARRRHLAAVGRAARSWLEAVRGHGLVVLVVPLPSPAMDRAGDELTPLLVAGEAASLAGRPAGSGGPGSLRSQTTRWPGLVANVDVAPTVLAALGLPVPPEMEGAPVEVTAGPPPFDLHRRHLEQRRVRLPLQMGVLGFVVAGALVGLGLLGVLWRRGRVSGRAARSLRALALAEAALGVPLASGGLLPRLTLPWVAPFLVLSTAALAWAAHRARWPGPTGPLVFLGAASVAVLLVDLGLFGGRALRVPLVGGTAFDGARFYGLPNVFIAPLLAGGLFLATALSPGRGVALLIALGAFAGLPSGGANLGAAVPLFVAAGLWWRAGRWGRASSRGQAGRRSRPEAVLGLAREGAVVLAVVVLGTALVLAANRWLPGPPTHLGRFVGAAGRGPGAVLDRVGERLEVGLGMVAEVPFSAVPLAGLALALAAAARPRGPLARGLAAAGPRWGRAVGVLCAASIVAFVVNDTGVAAAAPGFLYAVVGLLYPAFLDEAMAGGPAEARVGAGTAQRR